MNVEALILIVGMLVFILACTAGRIAWLELQGRDKAWRTEKRKPPPNG